MMRIGALFIGWSALTETERVALGVEPLFGGWDALCIEWRRKGWMIALRPRRRRNSEIRNAQ